MIETERTLDIYNIGDVCIMESPDKDDPKVFTTHKADNDWGVVYYLFETERMIREVDSLYQYSR